MPVKDGFAAAEEILQFQKQTNLAIKVYGLSADDDDEVLEQVLDSGMVSLLKKPISAKDIQSLF